MQINNLDINILFFLCNQVQARDADGSLRYSDVTRAFADIPEDDIRMVMDTMRAEALISMDRSRSRIAATRKGIRRLQGSMACSMDRLEGCRCDR